MAVFDFVGSVTEVAMMVIPTLLAGGMAGAAYVTDVLVTLINVPAPDDGDSAQVTPLPELSPDTCAVRFSC